jgi:hypothetical protein
VAGWDASSDFEDEFVSSAGEEELSAIAAGEVASEAFGAVVCDSALVV